MRLTHYIRPGCFIPYLAETSREDALRTIVHTVAAKGHFKDEKEVLAKLIERENIQSTAVGNGVAIPHCFTNEIPDLIIIVACAPSGIEFGSFDGNPTRLIFLSMANPKEHSLHLKALARIARLIKSTTFMEKIAVSTSAQEMIRAFDDEEAKIFETSGRRF